MLTPAEESGLAGLRLAGRVQRALARIPPGRFAQVIASIQAEATARHLIYQHAGVSETIRVLPSPITVRPDQLSYVHSVSLTILNALKRLPDLYLTDFAVRNLLRLSEEEERWLWECWGPRHRESNPVFGRLDAVADFGSPMWRDFLRFMEPNLTGIGGLHISPTCDSIIDDLLVPEILAQDPHLRLGRAPDMRELLAQELTDHLAALGRAGGTIALVDQKYEQDGPDEQEILADYFRERHQLSILHADPSELRLKDGEVYYEDTRVDAAYRDYTVLDLAAFAARGGDAEPMRVLFRENRVVSSIAAELDQKSCWEVLTDPHLAPHFLSAEERQVVRRHVLWTRLLTPRHTTNARGETVDLPEFARRAHETLVLKPNRAFGGEGVVIGPAVTAREWDAALNRALAGPERWVVQELAGLPVREFPVIGADGSITQEPFYLVLGFVATRDGVGPLARASQKQVVNVALRGGVGAVLVAFEASHGR